MDDKTDVTLFGLVKEFMGNHVTYVVMYIAYLIVIPMKEVLMPHLFGKIIKTFQDNKPLFTIVTVAIVAWIAVHFIMSIMDWQDIFFYPAMMEFLRSKTMGWLFEVYRENYEDMKTTETLVKIAKLPQLIYGFLDMWKKVFIPMIFTFIVAVAYITYQDYKTGVVLIAILIVYIVLLVTSPSVCGTISQEKDRAINTLNEETEDTLRNMMAVLNAQNESFEIERTASFSDDYADLCKKTMWCIVGVQLKLIPCQLLFMVFAIWRCYKLMVSNKMDIGQTISILIILLFLSNSLNKLTNEVRDLVIKYGMIKETMTVFDKRNDNAPVQSNNVMQEFLGDPVEKNAAEIFVDNLSYRYDQTSQDILNNITLGVAKGEKILIEGRIGSGKSTLLKLLMRYKKPSNGTIYLNGKSYTDLTIDEVRKTIGYVPQATTLFNRSIYDNIVYGSEGQYSLEDIYEIVNELKLSHIFDKFENGLETNVGKNGSKLSGGQRQIVWILRVLLQNPEILLLDEPTASIDEDTKEYIYILLEGLMMSRTVIMVTHDKALEAHATRIITIKNGVIDRDVGSMKK